MSCLLYPGGRHVQPDVLYSVYQCIFSRPKFMDPEVERKMSVGMAGNGINSFKGSMPRNAKANTRNSMCG